MWFRAKDTKNGRTVALKKMRTDRDQDGIALSSLREINLLLNLRHENIVCLLEVAAGRNIYDTFLGKSIKLDLVQKIKSAFSESYGILRARFSQLVGQYASTVFRSSS